MFTVQFQEPAFDRREFSRIAGNTFEGEVIDSHTFAGMIKMNLAEKVVSSDELNLKVDGLGYDDDRMLDSEEISASHWTDGRWNIVIPFEVNETDVKMIELL